MGGTEERKGCQAELKGESVRIAVCTVFIKILFAVRQGNKKNQFKILQDVCVLSKGAITRQENQWTNRMSLCHMTFSLRLQSVCPYLNLLLSALKYSSFSNSSLMSFLLGTILCICVWVRQSPPSNHMCCRPSKPPKCPYKDAVGTQRCSSTRAAFVRGRFLVTLVSSMAVSLVHRT